MAPARRHPVPLPASDRREVTRSRRGSGGRTKLGESCASGARSHDLQAMCTLSVLCAQIRAGRPPPPVRLQPHQHYHLPLVVRTHLQLPPSDGQPPKNKDAKEGKQKNPTTPPLPPPPFHQPEKEKHGPYPPPTPYTTPYASASSPSRSPVRRQGIIKDGPETTPQRVRCCTS